MAIDKSTRQHYANGQLVKPTRHGLRPGYRGDAAYGGPDPGHGQASGGNGGNGGSTNRERGIQQSYSAPAPAPAPSRGVDLHQGPTVKDVLNEIAEDKREQGAIKSLEEAIDRVDKAREEEALKNKIIDEDRERRMGLEGKTGVKDTSLDRGEGFGTVDRSKVSQFSEYGRNRMIENLQPKSFFDTGLGKTIKNIGLGVLAPQLLAGTKLGTLYTGYNRINTAANLAKKFGWTQPKDTIQTLKSNLTKPGETKTINTTPRDGGDKREQGIMQAQVPKDVITKSVQKFTPRQIDLLQQRYTELNKVIESGKYKGQKLNNNQLNKLTQTSKQIENFLVSEVGGISLT